jgi:endonuclease G
MKKTALFLISILFSGCVLAQVIKINKTYSVEYFDTVMKVPLYNYYTFTAKNREANRTVDRSPSFHKDTSIPNDLQANNADYTLANKATRTFDKGHYIPNDDMRFNKIAEFENMSYGNVAPQWHTMNEQQWQAVEDHGRVIGGKYDSLQIYTGGIYNKEKHNSIGVNNIAVPSFYFKTIVAYKNGVAVSGEAFKMSNTPQNTKDITTYLITIDSIEKELNVDLYKGNNTFEHQKILIK